MNESTTKTRSSIEVGVVMTIIGFVVTLAFNAGIQYGEINNLKATEDAHTVQIQAIQATNSTNGAILSHIQTMVEDMRASQEFKQSGTGR